MFKINLKDIKYCKQTVKKYQPGWQKTIGKLKAKFQEKQVIKKQFKNHTLILL